VGEHADVVREVVADLPEDRQGGRAVPFGGGLLVGLREQVLPDGAERGLEQGREAGVDRGVVEPGVRLAQGLADRAALTNAATVPPRLGTKSSKRSSAV
jgi:hypothetical protein